VTDAVIAQITENLKEFGYAGLNKEHVRQQIEEVLAGNTVSIIGMFARDILVENGYWVVED